MVQGIAMALIKTQDGKIKRGELKQMRGLACVVGMGTRRYIMDTGSGNDLVNATSLIAEERKSHHHIGMTQALHTANWIIETDEEVSLSIPKLGITKAMPPPDTICSCVHWATMYETQLRLYFAKRTTPILGHPRLQKDLYGSR